MSIKGENIRNIAVIGHSGEGKTTLCEAMLFNGGAIDRQGKVPDGTTVSDFDELEKAKKMSIYTSCSYLIWKDVKVNLLDLPGYYAMAHKREPCFGYFHSCKFYLQFIDTIIQYFRSFFKNFKATFSQKKKFFFNFS